jgi:hypothetical protein
MWSPAAASVVARLALREGFADVSFRFGGRRTWKYLVLAPIFPIVIGLIAYAIAWTTGLARFGPQPLGLVAPLVGDSASPVTIFVVTLALAATIGTLFVAPYAAGEEIGWRGYMLTRLIDAGVHRPILVSGVIWGCALYGRGHIVLLCDCTYAVRNGQHLASDRAARGVEQHHPERVRCGYYGCWGSIVGGRGGNPHRARLGRRSRHLLAGTLDDPQGSRSARRRGCGKPRTPDVDESERPQKETVWKIRMRLESGSRRPQEGSKRSRSTASWLQEPTLEKPSAIFQTVSMSTA